MVAVVSLTALRAWSIAACSICFAIVSAAEPDACDHRAGACVAESEFGSVSALQLSASTEATSMSTRTVSAPAPSSIASLVDRVEYSMPAPTPRQWSSFASLVESMEYSLPAPKPPQWSSVASFVERMEHSVPAPTPPSFGSLLDRLEHSVPAPMPTYWTSLISTDAELFGTPTPPAQNAISLVAVAEHSSPVCVKVMPCNLEWWHPFGKLNGNKASASELISDNNASAHFDILGFQECEYIWRLFNGSGLTNFTLIPGAHAKCIAYNSSFWEEVGQVETEITEDACPGWNRRRRVGSPKCWGARSLQWVRLENENGHVIFFANFHGPLPVSSGGAAGGHSKPTVSSRYLAVAAAVFSLAAAALCCWCWRRTKPLQPKAKDTEAAPVPPVPSPFPATPPVAFVMLAPAVPPPPPLGGLRVPAAQAVTRWTPQPFGTIGDHR